MEKVKFYSIMHTNGKTAAVLHDGYFDGYYFYYKNSAGDWWCIDPPSGLAVTCQNSRKAARDFAMRPAILKQVNDRVTPEMIQRFFDLKFEAEMSSL